MRAKLDLEQTYTHNHNLTRSATVCQIQNTAFSTEPTEGPCSSVRHTGGAVDPGAEPSGFDKPFTAVEVGPESIRGKLGPFRGSNRPPSKVFKLRGWAMSIQ